MTNIPESNLFIPEIIREIHESPYRIVLAITGGATGAIEELLRYGKGSDTILEAIIPYSKESLNEFIGKEPLRYASSDTAKDMAMSAYRRALYLNSKTGNSDTKFLIGIGVTCKLAKTADERDGRSHEVYFASQSYLKTTTASISLKENASRQKQEKIAADFIIEKLHAICHPGEKTESQVLKSGFVKDLIENEAEADPRVSELLLKTLEDINSKRNIEPLKVDMRLNNVEPKVILSGSFNPCHKNHIEMAKIAAGICNGPVSFEISLANVDKPPIDYVSLEERINSLLKYRNESYMGDIYLTNTPLFADKAVLFPSSVFLIGTDTLNRLFNRKYYRKGEDTQSLLEHFRKYNTRFMVFQRKDAKIDIESEIPDICDIIPLDIYADDGTSSTAIREKSLSDII